MISIRSLSKTYADGKVALSAIDLDVSFGMFGLLGPNGAGKTTLLSMLVLSLEPTAGSLRFESLDAARASDRAAIRAMIGYLPQDFSPIRHLTGFEYLMHCARLRSVPLRRRALDERARLLLEAVDLTEAADRRSGEYSGGMRRRLGIAQALIHAPKLVVIDEPTAGLDPEERIRFRNLISDVAEETAVLLSTHICEDIEATCDRIAVIGAGRILFEGQISDLVTAACGRVWQTPFENDVPQGAVVIGTRARADGRYRLLFSENEIDGERVDEISLEQAYASRLAAERLSAGEVEA